MFRRCALFIVAVAVILLGVAYSRSQVEWPQFPQGKNAAAPSLVLKVGRDYGWRTGDKVPLRLYIKQMPGTVVDGRITAEGDFEVSDQPVKPRMITLPDGAKLIRADFMVQSFNYQDAHPLVISVAYKLLSTGELDVVKAPPVMMYASKTYDGRGDIQPGDMSYMSATFDDVELFFLVGVGIVSWIIAFSWFRYSWVIEAEARRRGRKNRSAFDGLWTKVRAGDHAFENYEELERMVRQMYGLQPQTRGQIEREVIEKQHAYREEITTIIALCDRRLYDRVILTDAELQAIEDAFARIFSSKPSAASANAVTPHNGAPTLAPGPTVVEPAVAPVADGTASAVPSDGSAAAEPIAVPVAPPPGATPGEGEERKSEKQ